MKIFQANTKLINYKVLKKFIQHYAKNDNWHQLDKSSGNLGYGWIHYSIIRNIKPKNILVIGSKYGFVPAICGYACKENQVGMVDFVDASYDQSKSEDKNIHWGGVGFWKKNNSHKHFKKFGINRYIKTHIMLTSEFINKNIGKKWDYIYIDGDHSYQGSKNDYKLFWPNLSENGYMVFHDIKIKFRDGVKYGVHKLWKELKNDPKNNTIEMPGAFGLGIIQKNISKS